MCGSTDQHVADTRLSQSLQRRDCHRANWNTPIWTNQKHSTWWRKTRQIHWFRRQHTHKTRKEMTGPFREHKNSGNIRYKQNNINQKAPTGCDAQLQPIVLTTPGAPPSKTRRVPKTRGASGRLEFLNYLWRKKESERQTQRNMPHTHTHTHTGHRERKKWGRKAKEGKLKQR